MSSEETVSSSYRRLGNQTEDNDQTVNLRTIEEAVCHTGNNGLGLFQYIIFLLCCISISSETVIFNSFALFIHKPTIVCITSDDSKVSCDVDDYCDHKNDSWVDYEIDWSKEPNDGTVKNWVTEYDLLCDNDWYLSLSVSVYFAGTVAGAVIVNTSAEMWGRKPVLIISMFFQCVILVAMLLGTSSKLTLCFCMFTFGIVVAAQWQVSTVYLMEMTSADYKSVFSNLQQTVTEVWFLGVVLLVWLTKDMWLACWITLGISVLMFLGYTLFACESPRFLLARGRVDEAIKALAYMSRVNRKRVVPFTLEAPEGIGINSPVADSSEQRGKPAGLTHFFELFATRKALSVTLNVAILWGTVNFGYYGVSVNADELRGSIFTVLLIFGLSSSAGTMIVLLFGEFVDRKPFFGWSSVCVSISFAVYWIFGGSYEIISEISLLIGVSAINVVFSLLYVITGELFPTQVRSSAFGLVNVVGKGFAFSVPFVSTLMGDYISIFYIASGIVSLVLSSFLEETRGLPLREDWDIEPTVIEEIN